MNTDLSKSLNCSCPNAIQLMRDPGFIDEQRNADYLDCMADIEAERFEAMQETDPCDWDGVEEISKEERYACDMYNEHKVW